MIGKNELISGTGTTPTFEAEETADKAIAPLANEAN